MSSSRKGARRVLRDEQTGMRSGLQVLRVHGHGADQEDWTAMIVESVGHYRTERESWLLSRQGRQTTHPTQVHQRAARSAKVGSGTGGRSVANPGPACFLADELVIRGTFSFLRFVVGRTCCASEVLRPNLLDIEVCYALAHCFQNIFERWRFALDPSQRVDPRYNKRSQIRAHQSPLFQFLDYDSDLFLEFEHHCCPLLVLPKRRAQ